MTIHLVWWEFLLLWLLIGSAVSYFIYWKNNDVILALFAVGIFIWTWIGAIAYLVGKFL